MPCFACLFCFVYFVCLFFFIFLPTFPFLSVCLCSLSLSLFILMLFSIISSSLVFMDKVIGCSEYPLYSASSLPPPSSHPGPQPPSSSETLDHVMLLFLIFLICCSLCFTNIFFVVFCPIKKKFKVRRIVLFSHSVFNVFFNIYIFRDPRDSNVLSANRTKMPLCYLTRSDKPFMVWVLIVSVLWAVLHPLL